MCYCFPPVFEDTQPPKVRPEVVACELKQTTSPGCRDFICKCRLRSCMFAVSSQSNETLAHPRQRRSAPRPRQSAAASQLSGTGPATASGHRSPQPACRKTLIDQPARLQGTKEPRSYPLTAKLRHQAPARHCRGGIGIKTFSGVTNRTMVLWLSQPRTRSSMLRCSIQSMPLLICSASMPASCRWNTCSEVPRSNSERNCALGRPCQVTIE